MYNIVAAYTLESNTVIVFNFSLDSFKLREERLNLHFAASFYRIIVDSAVCWVPLV